MSEIKECIEIDEFLKDQGVEIEPAVNAPWLYNSGRIGFGLLARSVPCAAHPGKPPEEYACPDYGNASNSLKALNQICEKNGWWISRDVDSEGLIRWCSMMNHSGEGKTDDEVLFNLLKAVKEQA